MLIFRKSMLMLIAVAVGLGLWTRGGLAAEDWPGEDDVRVVINPYPRAELSRESLHGWQFEGGQGAGGWEAAHHVGSLEAAADGLRVEASGHDPYLFGPVMELEATERMRVRLRIRSEAGGGGQIFWATADEPHFTEENSTRFDMVHDGQWRLYDVPIDAAGTLTRLRLDPSEAAGTVEISQIMIDAVRLHPLEIERVQTDGREVTAWIRYHGEEAADVTAALAYKSGPTRFRQEKARTVEGGGLWKTTFEPEDQENIVARVDLEAAMAGVEPVSRRIRLHRDYLPTPENWRTIEGESLKVRLHPKGLFARIYRDGEQVAFVGPMVVLANRDSVSMDVSVEGTTATLEGEGARAELRVDGDQLHVSIAAEEEVEAFATRVRGELEQGLLPGVEHLGRGEWSSSKADIETEEHVRFEPPLLHVTMPLMAFVTERASVGLLYDDPSRQQAIFATPNFFDGVADHRMALRGRRIEAVLHVGPGWDERRLEDVIGWAVRTRGLPDVPQQPRTTQQQFDLAMEALNGVLRNDNGWGHCAEESWVRRFYSDHASTIWRLTGEMPDVPELVRGGAHLPNDAAYFVSGRAEQWLKQINGQAAAFRRAQQDDGSFRYEGEYGETHFEDTASGYNAQRAATLLTHARYTGDPDSLEAGVRTLEYMKRFRTPRGAQVWEMPLHTPDILGAAHLVRAYVLGYELTGERAYLELARRWAISGLPYLYQWQWRDQQAMPYAVIAVLGATNWRAPNWIGLPVQWCGLPYADALLRLAEHDETFDWRKVAEGITVSGERQMYDEGELAGTLPDSFVLDAGERRGPNINPCALVSLRLQLEGKPANVVTAEGGGHRIVSPYPVTIDGSTARIEAERGTRYQVVIDGERVVDIESQGTDEVPLGG